MKTTIAGVSACGLALFSTLVQAHPGHGVVEGWAHYLTPEHVLPALVAVGVLLYVLGRKKDRS